LFGPPSGNAFSLSSVISRWQRPLHLKAEILFCFLVWQALIFVLRVLQTTLMPSFLFQLNPFWANLFIIKTPQPLSTLFRQDTADGFQKLFDLLSASAFSPSRTPARHAITLEIEKRYLNGVGGRL
jgi:hypothetical protein